MNEPDARDLIAFISHGFDNRALSVATAKIWSELLEDVDLQTAKRAVVAHFEKPKPREYLSLDVLRDQIKAITRQGRSEIEADVRSAKARGMIEPEWPKSQPLPASVAARLARAREQFAAAAEAIESGHIENPVPFDIKSIGRDVPRGR